jgi:hypothetical protein
MKTEADLLFDRLLAMKAALDFQRKLLMAMYRHLIDKGLMTEEELVKAITEAYDPEAPPE